MSFSCVSIKCSFLLLSGEIMVNQFSKKTCDVLFDGPHRTHLCTCVALHDLCFPKATSTHYNVWYSFGHHNPLSNAVYFLSYLQSLFGKLLITLQIEIGSNAFWANTDVHHWSVIRYLLTRFNQSAKLLHLFLLFL